MARISEAYYYVECETCGDEVGIVINLSAVPDRENPGAIRLSVENIDYQPVWDHQFETHVELPAIE